MHTFILCLVCHGNLMEKQSQGQSGSDEGSIHEGSKQADERLSENVCEQNKQLKAKIWRGNKKLKCKDMKEKVNLALEKKKLP